MPVIDDLKSHIETSHNGIIKIPTEMAIDILTNLEVLKVLKPLCEVYETPKRHDMFLKVKGVVVYQFQLREQFTLFKEWLEYDKDN